MKSFWLLATTILSALVVYTYFKIGQFLPDQKVLALLITLALFLLMLGWEVLYRYWVTLANLRVFRAVAWIGSTLFGVWATFTIFSVIIDLGFLLVSQIVRLIYAIPLNNLQQVMSVHWIDTILVFVALFIAGFGLKTALAGPKVVEVVLPVANKLAALRKLKIVQISDLHVGAIIRRDYVERVVAKVNELQPDLIVLTGDVADGTFNGLKEQLQPLIQLQAPLGKFYVTGNHEYYWGAKQWVQGMRELGFIPLNNENRIVAIDGLKILIAGVNDVSASHFLPSHKSDLQQASCTAEIPDFKILLSHSPRMFEQADQLGFELQLSGHTHAGQFFPFSLLIPFAHKYHTGLNRHNGIWLYINSGTGSWGPINRFGVHSEITLLKFV